MLYFHDTECQRFIKKLTTSNFLKKKRNFVILRYFIEWCIVHLPQSLQCKTVFLKKKIYMAPIWVVHVQDTRYAVAWGPQLLNWKEAPQLVVMSLSLKLIVIEEIKKMLSLTVWANWILVVLIVLISSIL